MGTLNKENGGVRNESEDSLENDVSPVNRKQKDGDI